MRKFQNRVRGELHYPDLAVDKNNRIQRSDVNVIIKLSV